MSAVRFKLSVMMFLEFFIWGAWLPLIFGYLPAMGFNETWQQPLILGAFPLAALVGLFFSNQFADRNFAAEKFLAFSHLVGGAAMLALFWIRKPEGVTEASFPLFFGLMLVHSLFYVPTISITNSVAFANLRDPQKEFGPVRLWGTIVWIAASLPFIFILLDWSKMPAFGDASGTWFAAAFTPSNAKAGTALIEGKSFMFIASGIASLLLGAFSLTLPHTPPKPAETSEDSLAWLKAVSLLAKPFVLVLFVVTFIDAAVHQYYFFWTERYLGSAPSELVNTGVGIASNWVLPVMSMGQIAEIGTLAVLGFVLSKIGLRMTMIIGILGHAARFAVFAFFPDPKYAILVNLLHGICYAFFFASVYIFIDEYFPKDIRSSAQGLFNALILGVGPFVSNFISTYVGAGAKISDDVFDYQKIFLVPCFGALIAAALLLLFFHPPKATNAPAPGHR